jgi:hypothetical protein
MNAVYIRFSGPVIRQILNPIETVWNRMKDWIMKKYPDYHTSYNRLRIAVKETWNAISGLELLALVRERIAGARSRDARSMSGRH